MFWRVATSPLTVAFLAVTVFYWTAALFVHPRLLIEFVDGLVIATSAAVVVVFARRTFEGIKRGWPAELDILVFGLSGAWLVNHLDREWRLVARVTGSSLMMNSPIIGYLLSLLALFACAHLVLRRSMSNGQTPSNESPVTAEAWGVITVALLAGCAIGTIAVVLDRAYHGW